MLKLSAERNGDHGSKKNHKEKIGAWFFTKSRPASHALCMKMLWKKPYVFGALTVLSGKLVRKNYCQKFTPRKDKSRITRSMPSRLAAPILTPPQAFKAWRKGANAIDFN